MVNQNHFDARNLLPRAPETPGPAPNHQLRPAVDQTDQTTSEDEFHPSNSCHQFTAFPAAPQSQSVFAPDQFIFEDEFHPANSCHQFIASPAAPQYQSVFAPDQFIFEDEFHPANSYHQFIASPAAPQYQPVFAPTPEQVIVDNNNNNNYSLFGFDEDIPAQGGADNNNFPFSFDEGVLAQGTLPLPRSSWELTNQHSNSLTNIQPAIFRANINPATTNPQAPTMLSDAMTDNTLLDPTTQAQISAASSSPAPGPTSAARLTIIGAAELELLRKNNCILRSNNISIMKLKNEMEMRVLAAERMVEQLERELREARGGL